jgi:cell division protein FtsI (penicillin-binding protein 3)
MVKKSRLRTQKKKGRRWVFYLLLVAVLGGAGYQLEQYYSITSSIKELLHTIKTTFSESDSARGTIYDRNFKQLAVTQERVSVYVRTREIDSIQETALRLSEVLALDKDRLEDQLESGVLRLWIARDISQEQELAIKNLNLPGVYLQREDKRYYPNEFQAAHLIGAVENGIGLSGVEYYYDRLLAKRKLRQEKEQQPLIHSLDLVLTIDLKIQEILEDIAKDIAVSEQAEKVSLYLMESGTGEIIGGTNLPGFNPNNFAKYSQEQTDNLFLAPFQLPDKFRLFLKDATMLQAQGAANVSPSAWSLLPEINDLGSELRFWEWLGLEEPLATDFHMVTEAGKTMANRQKTVGASQTSFGLVPESAPPLNLLTTYSILLNQGKKIHPFVVKKNLDIETGAELLFNEERTRQQFENWSEINGKRIESLYRSQASRGASGAYFLRDDILVSNSDNQNFLINDVVFVTIPAGTNDLNMLVVILRKPSGVSRAESSDKKSVEQIIDEKAERISVLQQIAKSVADVVEPETGDEDNYQGKGRPVPELTLSEKKIPQEKVVSGVMPDLKGLSLRKSLRLLQGINVELKIQGTGRVTQQRPQPGTSLKGINECLLILENQDNIAPEKLSKGLLKNN